MPSPIDSREEDPQAAWRQAILAGLAEAHRSAAPSAPGAPAFDEDSPPDREAPQRSMATLLQIPVEDLSDATLTASLANISQSAAEAADRVARYCDQLAAHLQGLGCACREVPAYLRRARQTLASLHQAVSNSAPSPTEVKRLALRYALDARTAIEGRVERFQLTRQAEGWEVRDYGSLGNTAPAIPLPARLVRDPFAVRLLDLVFQPPPQFYALREFLELLLGGPPSAQEALPPARAAHLTYRLENDRDGTPRVHLWLGGSPVALPERQDVHRLLEALCQRPDLTLTGPQARDQHRISNASEACRFIREALEAVQVGAGRSLLSRPIRWAPGAAPQPRPSGTASPE